MRQFSEFIRSGALASKTFLVLGKGPSLNKYRGKPDPDWITLALNDVVSEHACDIAHIIDFDAALRCAASIRRNARVLVMPFHPHFEHKATRDSLAQLVAEHDILRELDREDRLLTYNLGTSRLHNEGWPVIAGGFFSGDIVVDLLGSAGVRTIRTLGIDGGNSYSNHFAHLAGSTLLSNGQPSFDPQFRRIRQHIDGYGLDFARLDEEYPIRVFVGSTEAQLVPALVLEHSIRKHASRDVEVHPLYRLARPHAQPSGRENRPRTPFSFQRFQIPEICSHEGKAIYLDSDMQVFTDIDRLWTLPMGADDLLTAGHAEDSDRRPHFSVMLLDCARLQWNVDEIVARLDRGELNYKSLMHRMVIASSIGSDVSEHWNSLERYTPGVTRLLHYTDMDTQPWTSTSNPLGHLWAIALFEAMDAGLLDIGTVKEHASRGWLRPSLVHQVTMRIPDTSLLPQEALREDRSYRAPHQGMDFARSARSDNLLGGLRLKLERLARRVRAFRSPRP